jgi:hypothetical protein
METWQPSRASLYSSICSYARLDVSVRRWFRNLNRLMRRLRCVVAEIPRRNARGVPELLRSLCLFQATGRVGLNIEALEVGVLQRVPC